MEANQEIKVAFARLMQVQTGERFSRASQLPHFDLNGSVSRDHIAEDFSSTGKGEVGNTFSLPLALGYEVDLWGRVRRSIEAAEADSASATADYQRVLLSLPIFDGGRNAANLERSKAAYEEAVASYRQQVLVAFSEVEDGLRGLEILERQGTLLQQAVASAEKALKISESRYRHGRVNFLEVVDSQRTALRTQRALVQLQGDQFTTSILLVKALGGG